MSRDVWDDPVKNETRPVDGLVDRLFDRNLALRFILAEAIGSSPVAPPSSGFLAVRRPGRGAGGGGPRRPFVRRRDQDRSG